MPTNLTPSSTFSTAIPVPNAGESITSAAMLAMVQPLANRSEKIKDVINGGFHVVDFKIATSIPSAIIANGGTYADLAVTMPVMELPAVGDLLLLASAFDLTDTTPDADFVKVRATVQSASVAQIAIPGAECACGQDWSAGPGGITTIPAFIIGAYTVTHAETLTLKLQGVRSVSSFGIGAVSLCTIAMLLRATSVS